MAPRSRYSTVFIVICVAFGALVVGGVIVLFLWLYAVGSVMGPSPECIPTTLPDGALHYKARCVNGRLIPEVPAPPVDASR